MKRIVLEDGKYEILLNEKEPFTFNALRHGEEWRDLIGDGMILSLVHRVLMLEEHVRKDECYDCEYKFRNR